MPAINIEPHFVIAGGSSETTNSTTITVYKTLTETCTILSTLMTTATINTCADLSPAIQVQTIFSKATTTFISSILQLSTVTLMSPSQARSMVTVTRIQSGCATPATSAQTTTVVTIESPSAPAITPSTRYFTGPNLVGSILNAS